MFGLINCEHRGFVGFQFDDYPDDIVLDNDKTIKSENQTTTEIVNNNNEVVLTYSTTRTKGVYVCVCDQN